MVRLRAWPLALGVMLSLSVVGGTEAARTVHSEGVIRVSLEVGQPTGVVMPEEVSTVTTGLPDARLAISKDNVYVGFVLKDPELPPSRQIVVGVSGRVYMLDVEAVRPGKRGDDLVYVTHKAPAQAEQLTEVSVIRLLKWPKTPTTPQPLTLPLPALPDTRLLLSNPRQYTFGPYQALVVTLENTQATVLHLDDRVKWPGPDQPGTVRLESWIWPPGRRLAAVAVDEDLLAAHGSTTLYAVFVER